MVSHWLGLLLVTLTFDICTCQSVSSTSCSSCSVASTCKGCDLNADVITASSTSWDPTDGTPYLVTYLHLTAYTVISASSVKENCVKRTGSPIPLPDPYIVYVQKPYDQPMKLTANFSASLDNAYSSLKTQIGYEKCNTAVPTSVALSLLRDPWPANRFPSATALPSTTTLPSTTALPSITPTENSVRGRHVRTKEIIIVSVVVPITVLTGVFLCFITIRKYRKKKRSQADGKDQRSLTSNSLIYLDRKAELEDEERRKHELDGCGISYEMEGEDRIFEMPTGNTDTGTRSATLREIHELRGVEHSQELEGPGNAT